MGKQRLSRQDQEGLAAENQLPAGETATPVELASARLATQIEGAVQTATPEKPTKASAALTQLVQAALDHGFKQVTAHDGTDAIEVKITRDNGQEVTCLLPNGAKGMPYERLAEYGSDRLAGATILSHDDFKAVVVSLFNALKALNGQSVDEALYQARKIVTQGVRSGIGFSWAVFHEDVRGTVTGFTPYASISLCDINNRNCRALFGAVPAE